MENIDSNNISQYELARAKALIYQSRGDYRKALAEIDSAAVEVQESGFDLNAVRKIKMEILCRMGRVDEAFVLMDEFIAANDTLKDVEINAKFDELRTQYEVEKHIAEKERNFHYFLFTLGICLILVLLLVGVFYYNRIITIKNRKLYEQIKEQDRLADKLFLLSHSSDTPTSSVHADVTPEATTGTCDAPVVSSEQYNLVERLQEYLLTGDNFLNADISRDEIISALGTNKNTLTEAVKSVTGKTPMEYMRAMKIEEARKMLDKHPELTIEAIAFSCGFNIPSTFYRLFRKQYGITPAEYQKMAKSQKK